MEFVRHEYENLCFTVNLWSREIIIRLAETNFNIDLRDVIDREMEQAAAGFKTSVDCENEINHLRAVERSQRSNKLSRVSRWHQLLVSPVLLLPSNDIS